MSLTVGGVRAIKQVWRAVRRGVLPRLDGSVPCVDCGRPARCYEHRDYSKPLEVEPVCHRCNLRRGRARPFVLVKTDRYKDYPAAENVAREFRYNHMRYRASFDIAGKRIRGPRRATIEEAQTDVVRLKVQFS